MRMAAGAAAGLALMGCAMSGDRGFAGDVAAQWVESDVVRIFVKGDAASTREDARDAALREAARQALAAGYAWFFILEETEASKAGPAAAGDAPGRIVLARASKESPGEGAYRAADVLAGRR